MARCCCSAIVQSSLTCSIVIVSCLSTAAAIADLHFSIACLIAVDGHVLPPTCQPSCKPCSDRCSGELFIILQIHMAARKWLSGALTGSPIWCDCQGYDGCSMLPTAAYSRLHGCVRVIIIALVPSTTDRPFHGILVRSSFISLSIPLCMSVRNGMQQGSHMCGVCDMQASAAWQRVVKGPS